MASKGVIQPPKRVQQMAMDSDEPPQRFINKDCTVINTLSLPRSLSPPPLAPVPVVDLSVFSKESSQVDQENTLQKIRSSLHSWGCFQAIGHGVSTMLLDNVSDLTKQFFALPTEEKEKYARLADDIQGYGNDPVLSEKQILDWMDRLLLQLLPENQRNFIFWPQNPTHFREVVHEYSTNMELMVQSILIALAKAVNLEENSFVNQFGKGAQMHARFNFYPVCPKPDQVLGSKAHSDGSGITILLQDKKVEGLQVLKDDVWYKIPIIPNAFLVNVGDQMEIMSNGMFRSPIHKVVANSERERMSVAVFYLPDPKEEIKPAEGLVDKARAQKYRSVKNYAALNFECFQNGTIAIDQVKINNNKNP